MKKTKGRPKLYTQEESSQRKKQQDKKAMLKFLAKSKSLLIAFAVQDGLSDYRVLVFANSNRAAKKQALAAFKSLYDGSKYIDMKPVRIKQERADELVENLQKTYKAKFKKGENFSVIEFQGEI
jgi:hypothetical protein